MREQKSALILLLIFCFAVVPILRIGVVKAEPKTIVVPDDYPTIQEAIDKASEGDTVYVKGGYYYEHLYISKSLSLVGESRATTVIDGGKLSTVVSVVIIRHDHVKVTGFTIKAGASTMYSFKPYSFKPETHTGVHLLHANYCNITGNDIHKNTWGIWLYSSSYNIISQNKIEMNRIGIYVESSSNSNKIFSNNIFNNTLLAIRYPKMVGIGVLVQHSFNNTLKSNIIRENDTFRVIGNEIQHYLNYVDNSNSVNGKPIVYWINRTNETVPSNTGCVILVNCTGITVQNQNISGNNRGITLVFTNNSRIIQNTITQNELGIELFHSSENSILENDVIQNDLAFSTYASANNIVYHNNFIDNGDSNGVIGNNTSIFWDNGYPSGGNYWSEYIGDDNNQGVSQNKLGYDGIGDKTYGVFRISFGSYTTIGINDNYPLMAPIKIFDAGTWEWTPFNVDIVSNSTISDFNFNPDLSDSIRFKVEGEDGTTGFCRVTIPKEMLRTEETWTVLVDGNPVSSTVNEDLTSSFLCFTYNHSNKTIEIIGTEAIPEFPSWIILPLILVVSFVVVIVRNRLRRKEC